MSITSSCYHNLGGRLHRMAQLSNGQVSQGQKSGRLGACGRADVLSNLRPGCRWPPGSGTLGTGRAGCSSVHSSNENFR
jgi:hypothetical protein